MRACAWAAEAGMYFAYLAFFIDYDGGRECYKISQHGQAFARVAFAWRVTGDQ